MPDVNPPSWRVLCFHGESEIRLPVASIPSAIQDVNIGGQPISAHGFGIHEAEVRLSVCISLLGTHSCASYIFALAGLDNREVTGIAAAALDFSRVHQIGECDKTDDCDDWMFQHRPLHVQEWRLNQR